MLFGRINIRKIKRSLIPVVLVITIGACTQDAANNYSIFLTPEVGGRIVAGSGFTAKIQFENPVVDSVQYMLDSVRLVTKKDTTGLNISTTGLKMGNHTLTAKIFIKGNAEEVNSNIILLPSSAPLAYSFKIVNTFPHDTSSFTEGLEYHDGYLYESTGENGSSKLLRVNLTTGKAAQEIKLESKYFGEGLTVIGNKIIQLTYRENIGFVYDKTTFKKLSEFSYPSSREGWGLTYDGEKILNSSGASSIFYLDPNTFQTIGSLDVYDNNGPVDQINELEYIDGKIYANVYQNAGPYANKILIIDPKTGVIEATINLIGLNPMKDKSQDMSYILNGIAYDKAGKRLFVTGKKWSKLFEIQIVKN